MTPAQLYTFDLQGFIVLPGVLPPALLQHANAVADAYEARAGLDLHGETPADREPCYARRFDRVILEDPIFAELAFLPEIISCIPQLVTWPRLKSTWIDFKAQKGGVGFHANHTPFDPLNAYHFQDGRIRAAAADAMIALADIPEDGGALEVIPGSHKANFPLPTDENILKALRRPVPLRAGDCLLFTHDVHHGSYNRRDYVRRSFFVTFAPGCCANSQGAGDLYRSLHAQARPGTWRHYLLRDVHGAWETLQPPTHPVREELRREDGRWVWREERHALAATAAAQGM